MSTIFGIANGSSFALAADVFNFAITNRRVGELQLNVKTYDFDPATSTLRSHGLNPHDKPIRSFLPDPKRPDIFIGVLRVDGVEVYRDPRVAHTRGD